MLPTESSGAPLSRVPQLLTAIRLLRLAGREPRLRSGNLALSAGLLLLAFPWLGTGTRGAALRLGPFPLWILEPVAASVALACASLRALRRDWHMPSAAELAQSFAADIAAAEGTHLRERQ